MRRIVEVERARVLERSKKNEFSLIANLRFSEPFSNRLAALVGLNDDVDGVELIEHRRVTLFMPVPRAGQADCWESGMPQCVTIAFAFDNGNLAEINCRCQTIETVKPRLAAPPPSKLVLAIEGATKAHRRFRAALIEIGNAHGGGAGQGDFS